MEILQRKSSVSLIDHQSLLSSVLAELSKVLLGKPQQIKLSLACILSSGHLLIEDLPGMGKTTLAHGIAQVLGLSFNRVQFTSDLLPADILGTSVYHPEESAFRFQQGPVFTQLLLADEINRATPKAQSALLEAMEEQQVSVDGVSHPLPSPFFVIATQNPSQQTGTYPLPESQLDRFLMCIELGYPEASAERALLSGSNPRDRLNEMTPLLDVDQLSQLQSAVDQITLSEPLLDYVMRLVEYSRTGGDFAAGLSPRGALALVKASKAWALIEGRDYVLPEDVQQVLPSVVEHRLRGSHGHSLKSLSRQLLDAVDVLG